jgi:hypothetical protein
MQYKRSNDVNDDLRNTLNGTIGENEIWKDPTDKTR